MLIQAAMVRAANIQARAGGVMVSYQQTDGGPFLPRVPVIFGVSEEGDAGGNGRGRTLRRRTVLITVDALGATGRPQRGDLLGFGSEGGWEVATIAVEPGGIRYILSLTRRD